MSQLQSIAYVLIRVWAVTLFLTFLPAGVMVVMTILSGNYDDFSQAAIAASGQIALIVSTVFAWIFARSLSRSIANGASEDPIFTRIESGRLLSVGIALLGLYLLGRYVPDATNDLLRTAFGDDGFNEFSAYAYLGVLIGVFLLIRHTTVARWLGRLRTAGSSEDEPTSPSQSKERS